MAEHTRRPGKTSMAVAGTAVARAVPSPAAFADGIALGSSGSRGSEPRMGRDEDKDLQVGS